MGKYLITIPGPLPVGGTYMYVCTAMICMYVLISYICTYQTFLVTGSGLPVPLTRGFSKIATRHARLTASGQGSGLKKSNFCR